jgi:ankyrin repeat protein
LLVAAAAGLVVYGGFVLRAYRQAALNQELMRAVVAMDGKRAEALLRRGADPNGRVHWPPQAPWRLLWQCRRAGVPREGVPLLIGTASSGRSSMVVLLLKHGANPNVRGTRGTTPLICEAREGTGTEGLEALLSHGADPNAHSSFGNTALFAAVLRSRSENVELLLRRGADLHAPIPGGLGLLQCAAMDRSAATLRVLLEAGLDRDAMDSSGRTALMWAAAPGSPDPAKVTTDAPGRLSWPADAGLPPDPVCIQLLLDAGADPTIRNKDLDTARDLAATDQARNMLERAEAEWRKKHAR